MKKATVSMCEIEIFYTDGTSSKHDILLWDWFHYNFPIDPGKEVSVIQQHKVYRMEME